MAESGLAVLAVGLGLLAVPLADPWLRRMPPSRSVALLASAWPPGPKVADAA